MKRSRIAALVVVVCLALVVAVETAGGDTELAAPEPAAHPGVAFPPLVLWLLLTHPVATARHRPAALPLGAHVQRRGARRTPPAGVLQLGEPGAGGGQRLRRAHPQRVPRYAIGDPVDD